MAGQIAEAVPDDAPAASGSSMTLSAMLALVGVEMEHAAAALKTVQGAVAELRPGSLSTKAMIDLQALDLVEQTVFALAKVMFSVASEAPGDVLVDPHTLLAGCELSSLSEKLSGRPAYPATDFELF